MDYIPNYQQRPMYQPPQQRQSYQPMQQMDMVIVRVASSREEAVATPGDYFKITVILGLNHNTIYIKRFDQNTGEMIMEGFSKSPEATQSPQYATVEQLQQLRDAVAQAINQLRGGTDE